jgi:ABC-2 type transport system ATP-binding protein
MTGTWAVEAEGLAKSFGAKKVLAGVDLRVMRGQVCALLGPNGAGKTTTVRILSTLTVADAGRAQVAGYDVRSDRRRVRRNISLIGQDAAVDPTQTGEENLVMMGRLNGLSRDQARSRARGLLEQFDLVDSRHRQVTEYSGGMRRRLDLAAGLTGRPSVIFLDEPTTGLDPRGRLAMWETVTALTESGVSIFLTTQYLEEADHLADHVVVIDAGVVVAQGTPAELKQRVADQRLDMTFSDQSAFDHAVRILGCRVALRDPGSRTVGAATDGSAAHIRGLLDELDPDRSAVREFDLHRSTLDDVFLALTGQVATQVADQVEEALRV